jgi:hypothetical protein
MIEPTIAEIQRVGRLFCFTGADTVDIAKSLGWTEARAYNTLVAWRRHIRHYRVKPFDMPRDHYPGLQVERNDTR